MADPNLAVRVDIVSDVVCPWCVIGYYQLAAAARQAHVALEVHWHPFELNPHLAAKYGTTPQGSREARKRLTALGAELGFSFNYADDMRMWNSFRAHQLIDWAEAQGLGHEAKLALFNAYFTDRRDVSDIDVLVRIAKDLGMDGNAARRILTSGERQGRVRARQRVWIDRGVHGVPAMIFEERVMTSGAQGVETYRRLLEQRKSGRAA